jgi:acetyltransferase-like isoleucine patch superfamily enzyme
MNLRRGLRALKCQLLIKYYGLKHVHATAYIAYGSYISRDLVAAEYSYIGLGAMIGPQVSIGAYTMLGPGVMCIGDDHRFDLPGVPTIFAGRPRLRPTRVGRDAWIGARCVVLSGVAIGDGAIVAAGTVVSRDVPPCEVHGGVPNRKLKDRFVDPAAREMHLAFLREAPRRGTFSERPDQRVVPRAQDPLR